MQAILKTIEQPLKIFGLVLRILGFAGFIFGAYQIIGKAAEFNGAVYLIGGILVYLIGSTICRFIEGDFYYQRI